jgi:hypothetical protein
MTTRRVPVLRVLGAGALAFAALLPASALGARKTTKAVGRLTGKNAQGLAVTISAAVRGSRTIAYQATMSCSDGTSFTDDRFTDTVKPNSKGSFRVAYSADAGATRTVVKGTISGHRGSGEMRIVEFYSSTPNSSGNLPLQAGGPVRCDSGNVTWTATGK